MRKIEINPITRLEGHGKIAIFLDDNGNVDDAFFQTVEFRGFEKFLQGMPMEEVPRTVSTVCGVCRGVHYMAATKAAAERVEGVSGAEVQLVWSPMWDPRVDASEDAKAELGIWD